MKRAYVRLQEAHSPWDSEKMRVAEVATVSELRKLAVLSERFRRNGNGGKRSDRRICGGGGVGSLREGVAPQEAKVEELKKEVKTKDLEVQNLKEKIESAVALSNNSSGEKKPGRSQSKRKLGIQAITAAPTPELFEATMVQVRESSKFLHISASVSHA